MTGLSLALVGVMAMIVQGGLVRLLMPKLGEKRAVLIGVGVGAVELALFGLVPNGWMMFPVIVIGSLAGIATPAIQGLISRSVGDDEQGAVQGSLRSLSSVASFIGPFLMTGLYAWFISDKAPAQLPGSPFLLAAVLTVVAGLLAARLFRKRKT